MSHQTGFDGLNSKIGADYTDPQNTTYGFWNSKGQLKLGGNPDISNQYVSPATLPQFNVRQGGDASQLRRNAENKTLFNALNAQSTQVTAHQRSWTAPIFKSHQDLLKYVQAQYTQQLPGTPNAPTNYNIGTLFPKNL
jgi:hypothetical protein